MALLVGAAAFSACATEEPVSPAAEAKPVASKVLDDDGQTLGAVQFPTSCDEPAKTLLDRGLALLHHMTYMESKETFGQAAEVDPDCAIAYWGAAMTHVHPLWPDAISAAQLEAGQTLLDRAATAAHASERERAYIAALDAAISGRCGRSSVPWGACSWLCVGPRLKTASSKSTWMDTRRTGSACGTAWCRACGEALKDHLHPRLRSGRRLRSCPR